MRLDLRSLLTLFLLPATASAQSGWWKTDGHRITDAAGNTVRFSGVNWNGFESDNYVVHGLWGGLGRTWSSYLDQMQSLGFNLIRLPFCGPLLDPGRMPNSIDYGTNPDLAGLTAMQVMDKIVAGCQSRGIRIILDYHRIEAGFTPEAGLWYNASHPESVWIQRWKAIVDRYKNDSTVVGVDLFNEVHGSATWEADNVNVANNWRWAAKRCAAEILAINPNLLICVQGMHAYGGEAGWWGAVHLGVKVHPLTLSVPNRLVYSIHDYGPIVWDQPFHQAPNYPANLPGHWDHQWGFLHDDNLAPVWVGEWGAMLDPAHPKYAREVQWLNALRDYIDAKGLSWTWWCWTPNSGDTGGILKDDWTTVHASKTSALASVMYPGFGGGPPSGGGGGAPAGGGGDGSNGDGCGALGAEVALLLLLLRRRRVS
jgi:endoglucanase